MSVIGQRFRAGEVIVEAGGVWLKRLFPLTLLCLIILAPLTAFRIVLAFRPLTQKVLQVHDGITAIVWTLFSAVAIGAVVQAVLRTLRGEAIGLGRSLLVALRRAPSAIGAQLPVTVSWALAAVLRPADPVWEGVLLALVAAIMATMWVAVPVVMVERTGAFTAWRRSAELTRGHRLRILVVVLVVFVLFGGFAELQSVFRPDVRLFWIVNVFVAGLTTGLYAVFVSVTYHRLRASREGVDLEELAQVFD